MNKEEIKNFIESFKDRQSRTIIIIDYGNVNKWDANLGWKVGVRELARLIKNFSLGKKFLRRFYYGSDYGPSEKSDILDYWSGKTLMTAEYNGFEIVTKRVKYIHNKNNTYGFEKKCDLDVEMIVDLIKERDNYDTIILFSGDGDLMCGIKYLKKEYNKTCYVFGARGHVGREVYDAKNIGDVSGIFYADDFEYRLDKGRFR